MGSQRQSKIQGQKYFLSFVIHYIGKLLEFVEIGIDNQKNSLSKGQNSKIQTYAFDDENPNQRHLNNNYRQDRNKIDGCDKQLQYNLTAIKRMQKMSFKQILDQNKSIQEQKQSGYLFTRLKQQIINKTTASDSIATSIHQQLTLQTVLQECQLELQILKLEKANFIAMQVCQFGFQIQEVLHRVSQNIHVEIQHILTNKYAIMSQKKYPHNLQSTLHNTEGTHSIKKQSKKNSAAKNTLTPKIVEFTLGNRQASSGRSQQEDKNNSEEVSEFFVNSKGAASKSIRQKVMGPKKLK